MREKSFKINSANYILNINLIIMEKTESGHAKNIGNFEKIISKCENLGEIYNPAVPHLKLPALKTSLTGGKAALAAVNQAETPWVIAVNARDEVFNPLKKLSTKVINALKAFVSVALLKDARSIVNKIQGKRSVPTDNPQSSASQTGFDNQINNFDRLLTLMESVPEYLPNEEELTIVSLRALHQKMMAANTQAIETSNVLGAAREQRNELFYGKGSSLLEIVKSVKSYVVSVLGANDPKASEIKKIPFKKMKR